MSGDPPLHEVVSQTTEAGLRGRVAGFAAPDSALRWNVSVFRTVLYDDIQSIATSHASGYFANVGDTRRQGVEVGLHYHALRWSAYANYSLVRATYLTALTVPSRSSPIRDANGNIHVQPGDQFPGIPENRWKLGADLRVLAKWTVGASVNITSSTYFVGDPSNQLAPLPGYTVVGLHATYRPVRRVELFATIDNLFNQKFATWGILSDPTGVGAPGIPANAPTNGPGVNNRFVSPAAPFEIFGGIRVRF